MLATQGDRTFTNLGVFLPFDDRNVVGGRKGKPNYDASIVFRTRETAYKCRIGMSSNGVLATRDTIPSSLIYRVICHDPS